MSKKTKIPVCSRCGKPMQLYYKPDWFACISCMEELKQDDREYFTMLWEETNKKIRKANELNIRERGKLCLVCLTWKPLNLIQCDHCNFLLIDFDNQLQERSREDLDIVLRAI